MKLFKEAVSTPTSIDPTRFYTAQQVADLLGVTSKTVRTWINSGQLIAVRPGPRSTRVPGHVVANLIGLTTESEEVR